jgi:hypothetical protein
MAAGGGGIARKRAELSLRRAAGGAATQVGGMAGVSQPPGQRRDPFLLSGGRNHDPVHRGGMGAGRHVVGTAVFPKSCIR